MSACLRDQGTLLIAGQLLADIAAGGGKVGAHREERAKCRQRAVSGSASTKGKHRDRKLQKGAQIQDRLAGSGKV